MKTYDIHEAADFLKVDRSTALDLANGGALPGAKVGRAWVFMEDELINYLRDVTRKQTQERRAQAEACKALRISPQEPVPYARSRRRTPPTLPELCGEVATAQI
jgi:excisionase family DNA binding protein